VVWIGEAVIDLETTVVAVCEIAFENCSWRDAQIDTLCLQYFS
jgi:hypothetical protein